MYAARHAAALASLAAIALPLSACGGDEKSFIEGYNKATQPLRTLDADIGESLRDASADSDAEVSAKFGSLAEQTKKVNAELAELDAPKDVKPGFDALRTALERYQRDLTSVANGVESGDVKQTRAGATALGADADAVAAAEKTVKQKLED